MFTNSVVFLVAAFVLLAVSYLPIFGVARSPRVTTNDRTLMWESRRWGLPSTLRMRLSWTGSILAIFACVLFALWTCITPEYYAWTLPSTAGGPDIGAAMQQCLGNNFPLMAASLVVRFILGAVVFICVDGMVRTAVKRLLGRDIALSDIFGYLMLMVLAGGILFYVGSSLLATLGNHFMGCHIP